jgi:probable phosphoglycerate mutase|tara:strand:- start:4224 stop:4844 length:621 start_codon:yes stop_codon:yes gene_type:complete
LNLIIVRHGQTNLNRDGRVLGHGPEPLNETGLAQAQAVAQALTHVGSFTLYSSPVNRTMQTAEAISGLTDTPIAPKPGLAELDAGEMEGIEGRKLGELFPDVMAVWRSDPAKARMPGGETLGEVQDRAWKAIAEIVDAHPDGTAVAVSHNFPIQTIVCSALGMNLKDFRRVKVDLGSITRLQTAASGFTVTSLNETWHLPAKDPAN